MKIINARNKKGKIDKVENVIKEEFSEIKKNIAVVKKVAEVKTEIVKTKEKEKLEEINIILKEDDKDKQMEKLAELIG